MPQIFVSGREAEVYGADEIIEMIEEGFFSESKVNPEFASEDPLPKAIRDAFNDIKEERKSLSLTRSNGSAFEDVVIVNGSTNKFGFEYSQLYSLSCELKDGSSISRKATPSVLTFAKSFVKRGPASFTSRQMIEWAVSTGHAPGEESAIRLGQRLLYYNFISLADKSRSDHLLNEKKEEDVPHRKSGTQSKSMYDQFPGKVDQELRYITFDGYAQSNPSTLNLKFPWPVTSALRSANDIAGELKQRMESLYESFLYSDGHQVDYEGLRESKEFQAFTDATCELQVCNLRNLSREELMAFFINIYNILVVHATTIVGTPDTLLKRLRFFDSISYNIGGINYSANDIEHGLLRANAASPAALASLAGIPKMAPKTFKRTDPRIRFSKVLEPMDPRIHFALNCGAKSCPPIRIFDSGNLEYGLRTAAQSFIEDDVSITEEGGATKDCSNGGELYLTISKLFSWYACDFGGTKGDILNFLMEHLGENKKELLKKYIDNADNNIPQVKIMYKNYDWSVNEKET